MVVRSSGRMRGACVLLLLLLFDVWVAVDAYDEAARVADALTLCA
jgi:hypothetical protein